MKNLLIDDYLSSKFMIYEFDYVDVTEEQIKKELNDLVLNDIRMSIIDGLAMSITKKYNIYYLIESNNDLCNFSLKYNPSRHVTSTIELSALLVDPRLIKNKLYNHKIIYPYHEFNSKVEADELETDLKANEFEKEFNYIYEVKAIEKICEKYKIKYDANHHFDIDLFNISYERKWILVEPIYEITIPYQKYSKNVKYTSIYSLVSGKFTKFAYPFNEEYTNYLKENKGFFNRINYTLDEYYYKDNYETYLGIGKEHAGFKMKKLVKSFADSEDKVLSQKYSKVAYFVYNDKHYIKNFVKENCLTFEEELYNIYLLSKLDCNAVYKLAQMAKDNLLSKTSKSNKLYLKYMIQSAKMGSKEACQALYDHYIMQAYKDDYLANYYLKKLH